MMGQETGRTAGGAPGDGPVSLAAILAAQRTVERGEAARKRRDELIRLALAAGLVTKAELARKLPMSEQHVGRIGNGRRPDRP